MVTYEEHFCNPLQGIFQKNIFPKTSSLRICFSPQEESSVCMSVESVWPSEICHEDGSKIFNKVCDEGMTEVFDPPYEAGSRMG
jgi:hypothetical protein